MGGYENSPDYGGRDPSPLGWVIIAIMFAAVTALVFACNANAKPATSDLIGIASVIDGDTIEIHGTRVRLWGIDAPEHAQNCLTDSGAKKPAGRRSAFALSDMIGSKAVTCKARGTDRYKRTIGVCSVDGSDISNAMVEDGWARAFVKYSTDYVAQEASAKLAKRGMWAWACDAPWDWRAQKRG